MDATLCRTYATTELFAGIDIHTLSRKMGYSAGIIEKHYSNLTATMAADRMAAEIRNGTCK